MILIRKKGGKYLFRINSWLYPSRVIKRVFGGEKEKVGRYLIFEWDEKEHTAREILEKMNLLILEAMK